MFRICCFLILLIFSCKKVEKEDATANKKPKADFTFTIKNQGILPDTVSFTSSAANATSFSWNFDNASSSSVANPQAVYKSAGIYNVKLIVNNQYGSDSINKKVEIILNKPVVNFSFTISNLETLPVILTTINTTIGSNVTYKWSFGNGTSIQTNPINNFTSGGIYNIKLVATNASGSDSVTKQLKISPYSQTYSSYASGLLNLYAWEGDWQGNKVMILSRNNNLNRTTMFKWLKAMDTTYNYYKDCTGREPSQYAPTYINNRTTIADVPSTCGAGCSYVGFTGIELQNTYFDISYNTINNYNQFDHLCFYEFGRNYWFYNSNTENKAPAFPVAGGFAVWMGSIEGRDAIGVQGSTVNGETYIQAKARFEGFVDKYVNNTNLNWANTLGINSGIPGYCNAADLFTSMCMRLKRDYGGDYFLHNIWKNCGQMPTASTTQDAVDNFFIASCKTANKNLTNLFMNTWRWPLSDNAINIALQYP